MYDFACKDPTEMNYKLLADRVRELKGTEESLAKLVAPLPSWKILY